MASYPPSREGELWAAASRGDARVVRTLVEVGTSPDDHLHFATGATALHEALAQGHGPIARVLLDACSAELLHWPDRKGFTPLLALAAGPTAVSTRPTLLSPLTLLSLVEL